MTEFLCLGSGSSGNSYLLRTPNSGILIDAGISIRTLKKHLRDFGYSLADVQAVFVTHDHADHIKAVGHLANEHNLPIYATEGVHRGINRNYCVSKKVTSAHQRMVRKGQTTVVGDFCLTPFEVSHDSTDCVGYRVSVGDTVLCLVTDCGQITPPVAEAIGEAEYLIIEANHDETMLSQGPYPAYLKGRIRSPRGHLSNRECGEALAQHATPRLRQVWLCHLSEENNHPELARKTIQQILASCGIVAGVDFGMDVLKRKVPSGVCQLN